ncbi:hypothetical protein OEB99_15205 [Actinotalea sp. M2MS4P-6]|uniref:hypothetical protein n=1 Tax=Actinotalea sp. M2MS4P-6 TaxID=2983762 RepID=UPI0021E4069F|nr:hypothetical protein [Actinotalea sp. M2MS4P-6]MCV2395661.1 hypothetical protein [Actinotalea sp. M2MS4P-6]
MSARARSLIEAALAAVASVLAVLTVLVPDWFEVLFEASPDGGGGSAERWFAVVWVLAAIAFALLSRRDLLRARAEGSPEPSAG